MNKLSLIEIVFYIYYTNRQHFLSFLIKYDLFGNEMLPTVIASTFVP